MTGWIRDILTLERAMADSQHPVFVDSSPSFDPQSIEGLFLSALQQPAAERTAWLEQACGDDECRRRVTALLRAYDDAGSFLETPATGGTSEPPQPLSLDFLAPTEKPGLLGTLGPYEVIDVIGRGGMGIVLRALDPKLNRIVAVKVLAPELAVNPTARKRFLREAQAAAAITHPHVVTIHAVEDGEPASTGGGAPQPQPYLVMECVVGQSLQDKLDRVGPVNVTEILRIGQQIAAGLAAAHQQGLIHRDIKPANILLENGVERVKITDFGLARLVDDVAITRTGELSGTPQYMSPEQAHGERIDHRSDLFSLGCVMYAMCTGHSPFRGDSLAQVIRRVTQDRPRPIDEQNPDIPRWLIDVIDRLLEKSPDRRMSSAAELSALLGEHLARRQHAAADSGSHAAINARVLSGDLPPLAANRNVRSLTSSARVDLPRWVQSIGLALILLGGGAVLVYLGLLTASIANSAWDYQAIPREPWILFTAAIALVLGAVLRRNSLSSGGVLILLALLLGPVGIAIWIAGRERWERTEPPPAPVDQSPRGGPLGNDLQWLERLRTVSTSLLLAGGALLLWPLLPILFGLVVTDGDSMEFGGVVLTASLPFAILALAVGGGLRLAGWVFAPTSAPRERDVQAGAVRPVVSDAPQLDPPVSPEAQSRVRGPAMALKAAALLNWTTYVAAAAALAIDPGLRPDDEAQTLAIVFAGVVLFVGSGIIWRGAWSLQQLQSYRWAIAASVCSMVIGPGYLVGWPAGLWAASVLSEDRVRRSFVEPRGSWLAIPTLCGVSAAAFLAAFAVASQGSMQPSPANLLEALLIFAASAVLIAIPSGLSWLLLRQREGEPRPAVEQVHTALGQPGKWLAWLVVGCLSLLMFAPFALLGLMLVWTLASVEPVRVAIRCDADYPIRELQTEEGRRFLVDTFPYFLDLPPGHHRIRVSYDDEGTRREFTKLLNLANGAAGQSVEQDWSQDVRGHRTASRMATAGGSKARAGGDAAGASADPLATDEGGVPAAPTDPEGSPSPFGRAGRSAPESRQDSLPEDPPASSRDAPGSTAALRRSRAASASTSIGAREVPLHLEALARLQAVPVFKVAQDRRTCVQQSSETWNQRSINSHVWS
jgi:serine/threonine protein kinase